MISLALIRRPAQRHLLGDAVRATAAVRQHRAGHRDDLAAGERVGDHRQRVVLAGVTTTGTITPPLHTYRFR